ncbi:hypothetical protein [Niastella koreensis]|uniref:hypothetical protein n=1 Tax=Niastella koreensis TaxID=354356 RepID=UPI001055F851|nr:hypothetical protein [Niastella koreensis]
MAKEKEPVKQLTAERKEAEEFLLQSDLLHYQNAIDKSLRNLGDTYDVHTFERFYDSYYKKGAGAITN